MKRQKLDEQQEEEEEEKERLAEEKLKQLQEFAKKSMKDDQKDTQSSNSSSPAKACVKSSWQQTGNLMFYTAAGVKASEKVGKDFLLFGAHYLWFRWYNA